MRLAVLGSSDLDGPWCPSRRLVEQQSAETPRGVPQQQHPRQPEQQYRFPRGLGLAVRFSPEFSGSRLWRACTFRPGPFTTIMAGASGLRPIPPRHLSWLSGDRGRGLPLPLGERARGEGVFLGFRSPQVPPHPVPLPEGRGDDVAHGWSPMHSQSRQNGPAIEAHFRIHAVAWADGRELPARPEIPARRPHPNDRARRAGGADRGDLHARAARPILPAPIWAWKSCASFSALPSRCAISISAATSLPPVRSTRSAG